MRPQVCALSIANRSICLEHPAKQQAARVHRTSTSPRMVSSCLLKPMPPSTRAGSGRSDDDSSSSDEASRGKHKKENSKDKDKKKKKVCGRLTRSHAQRGHHCTR